MRQKNLLVVTVLLALLCLFSLQVGAVDDGIERIQVLTVNDFHGALMNDGKNPGAAKMGAFILQQKADYPDSTIILSAGDMFQGTMDSNLLLGAPVISVMNYIGFDAMALGNHEFDWGIDRIRARALQANFPIMAANIVDSKTGKQVDFCSPLALIRRGSVTVGIIAYDTQETPTSTSPVNVKGLRFPNPADTASKYAAELRKRGANVIVVLSHMGCDQAANGDVVGEAADFAKKVQGVDLIVCGHTHKIVNGKVNGIPLVQAYYNGRVVGDVLIDYSVKDKKIVGIDAKVYDTGVLLKMQPDVNIQNILTEDLKAITTVKNRVIGVSETLVTNRLTSGKFGQTLMGEFVSDIMRQASGADIAFTNMGGLRNNIEKGNITLGAVYSVLPFDNTIITCTMTGTQVMDVLNYSIDNASIGSVQYSGLRLVYDMKQPAGNRLVSVKLLNGDTLQPEKLYKVATNDFMSIGGDGFTMFAKAKNLVNTNIPIRDYVDDEIIKMKTIKVVDDGRFKVIN